MSCHNTKSCNKSKTPLHKRLLVSCNIPNFLEGMLLPGTCMSCHSTTTNIKSKNLLGMRLQALNNTTIGHRVGKLPAGINKSYHSKSDE